jgi:hypothetical protein
MDRVVLRCGALVNGACNRIVIRAGLQPWEERKRRMLAALDALIDHGKGGRIALALRQTAALLLRVGFDETGDALPLFDELMATLATELDEESIAILAPELKQMPGLLPAFTSTVMSRFHARSVGFAGFAGEGVAVVATSMEPPPPVPAAPERRERPRDTVAEAANPLTIARRATPAQLEEIALLPALPEPLTSIIAGRDHIPAIVAALANPGAAFSRSTIAMLVELAAADRNLRDALALRADLGSDAFDQLWPLLGREGRARAAMSGTSVSVDVARRALADAEARAALLAAAGRGAQPLDQLLRGVEAGNLTMSDALVRLASEGRDAELAALASSELAISVGVAFAMVCGRLDKPAAILVRALDGDRQALQAVIALRRSRALGTGGSAAFVFGQLDPAEAMLLARMIDRHHSEQDAATSATPAATALKLVS